MNFRRIIVSYIYCFFVRDFDLKNATDDARKNLRPKGWKSERTLQDEAYELKSLLVLNNQYLSLCRDWPDLTVQFPTSSGQPVILNANGRVVCKIRDSGAATLRFQFEVGANDFQLTEDHLLLLSEIGRDYRAAEERAVLTGKEGPVNLWKEFVDTCEDLDDDLTGQVIDLKEISVMGSLRKFVEPELLKGGDDPFRPFPVLWAALTDLNEYKRIRCSRFDTERICPAGQFESQMDTLLQTLLGALSPERDIPFCKEYSILDKHGSLISFCPVEGFFRNFTHRTCLCLSPASDKDLPHKQLYSMTMEVMEAIRLRWHLIGLGNLLLDWEIQAAKNKLSDIGRKDPVADEAKILEILKGLAQERAELATMKLRFLEDPVSHLTGSGSLSEMYERAVRVFRLNELDQLLNAKSEALDRVIDQIMDFAKISQLLALAKKEK